MITKKYFFKTLMIVFLAGVISISCNRNNNPDENETPDMEDINVDENFNWETTKPSQFKVNVYDNVNKPIEGVKISIYTSNPAESGKLIVSGITNSVGVYKIDYEIPAYYDSLWLQCDYIGIPSPGMIALDNNGFDITLGGKYQKSGLKSVLTPKATNSTFKFLGGYNSQGVPDYLEPDDDIIDATLLDDINNTLPSGVYLPKYRPQYFMDNLNHNLTLTEACNVWITFVHEGAGYKNVLGFYTFPTAQPPTSPEDIDTITIVFPNASFYNSGGGLYSGNKVFIGQFPPNISIGFALMANGWKNDQVTDGKWILYSQPELNPEQNPDLRQHSVLLNDNGRDLFLLGFEDIKRDLPGDHDFNDAVFYVTADPIEAIDPSGLPPVDYTGTDSDNDNIPDNFDDYPNDPSKAFNNYFFSQGEYGSLVFEDLWPAKGDYDFNDAVIDYNFNQITNGSNQVVEIEGTFILRAHGAFFENGFGFELPVQNSAVSSVSGNINVPGNVVSLDDRNLENNQSNAVVIVWENAYDVLPGNGGQGVGVNTTPNVPFVVPDTINLKITLTTPVELINMGMPPYNPFIFVNGDRSVEVHLSDYPPTDLADEGLFGTDSDDSKPSEGRFYKTENNLPWGLNIIESFEYPIEKIKILDAYFHFKEWAESSGSVYYDWYKNKPGYRNEENIYHPPLD
jgi:LruC domain-containing protein